MKASTAALPFLLDSSILVKWYHRTEEDVEIALHLREGYLRGEWELRLADVSFYELANALHHLGTYSPEEIVTSVQSLLAMEVSVYGFDALALRTALDLSAEKRLAIYDAYLVALAKLENLIFVTADEKLLRKLGKDESVRALRKILN